MIEVSLNHGVESCFFYLFYSFVFFLVFMETFKLKRIYMDFNFKTYFQAITQRSWQRCEHMSLLSAET